MNKDQIKTLYEQNQDVIVQISVESDACDFRTPLGWIANLNVSLLPPLDVDRINDIKSDVMRVLDSLKPVPYANMSGAEGLATWVTDQLIGLRADYLTSDSFDICHESSYLSLKVTVSKREDSEATLAHLNKAL